MALKTWTIELRVDFDEATKQEIINTAARMAAKHLYTTAMLVADKRKPLIALSTSDMFEGAAEISLADDIPMDDPYAEMADAARASVDESPTEDGATT